MCPIISLFKVREGRRSADYTKLCVILDYAAISEHI